jgi:uncharacterized membrane protein YjgN (DUF898 family)
VFEGRSLTQNGNDIVRDFRAPSDQNRIEGFTFTGNASEYFRIWIVNLFLTIITIGIYSPWAKVRRLKYFYGSTWLDGHNFDYVANPISILKGRLIVVGILVAYNLLVNFVSPFFGLLAIAYLIFLPWLVNKSLSFNARMTIYRNVRFGFRGSLGKAFKALVLWPIASFLTGGLLAPFSSQATSNYIGSNAKYGAADFTTKTQLNALYRNFGRTFLFFVLPLLAAGALAAFLVFASIASGEDERVQLIAFSILFIVYPLIFLAFFYYAAGVRNVAFNSTTLEGGHYLASSVGRGRYVWIMVTNFLATIFSLGLLRPWAAVRTWKYIAASTMLAINGTLDTIIDEAQKEGSVTTAEFLDIEGIDFGL